MARVFGGSANLTSLSLTRIIEVSDARALSWALDLELTNGPAFVLISSGAAQSAVLREYRLDSGRVVLPVCGDFVTVDVRPEALAVPPAQPGRMVALLSESSASQAPLAPSSATASYVLLAPAVAQTVPQSIGAGRILYNFSAAPADVLLGGQIAYTIAAGQSLNLAYSGTFDLLSAAGGQINILTLHP